MEVEFTTCLVFGFPGHPWGPFSKKLSWSVAGPISTPLRLRPVCLCRMLTVVFPHHDHVKLAKFERQADWIFPNDASSGFICDLKTGG